MYLRHDSKIIGPAIDLTYRKLLLIDQYTSIFRKRILLEKTVAQGYRT